MNWRAQFLGLTDKADTLALCLQYFTGYLAVKSCRDLAILNSVN